MSIRKAAQNSTVVAVASAMAAFCAVEQLTHACVTVLCTLSASAPQSFIRVSLINARFYPVLE